MLSFATEFPLKETQSADAFIAAVRKWLVGSPHTSLANADLAEMSESTQWTFAKGNESVSSLRASRDSSEVSAVRYKRSDAGIEWTTTVTFSRIDRETWVAIRVFCEANHPAVRLPPVKKPVLVRTLLRELGGGRDGLFEVTHAPHALKNSDVNAAALLISGSTENRLPVVYVSSPFHGKNMLNAAELAEDLSGMAHIVIEPNRPFSIRLQIESESKNVYGGTIGIYWPDGGGRRSFFLRKGFDSPEELATSIFEEVRTALTNRRPLERCTWAAAQEMVSRTTFDKLKSEGSEELDKYIAAFDSDIASKEERLNDSEREISRLRAELRRYESRGSVLTGSILKPGREQDLYESEVLEIVADALVDYQSRVPADSRRSHVLTALITANPIERQAPALRARLKELLRDASGVDKGIRQGLESLGFSIAQEGKHYKLIFQGDDRYTFPLPKSGSDWRGGLNAASDIGRLLF